MYNPVSTIRIQFNKDFTLNDFEKSIPFFVNLGVATIYASPIFAAVPGSTHGYDVINPLVINPEIGTLDQLERISTTLRKHSIGWLQDIVPNHMAYHPTNPWIFDVLEKGPMSLYHEFFDISWAGEYYQSRLMAPFLEAPLDEVVTGDDLQVQYADGVFVLDYKGTDFPISSRSYEFVLTSISPIPEALQSFLGEIKLLHQVEDRVQYSLRWNELLLQFKSLFKSAPCYDHVLAAVDETNADPDKIEQLAGLQFYRLCHWQETSGRINYRRFFTVNGLIGLNMHNDRVFNLYHQLIAQLCAKGIFDGVRVDHIDGLTNPRKYLRQLRDLLGPDKYIVVEKILETGEDLDPAFPVQGTTGYEFLGVLNNLFVWRQADEELETFYKSITKRHLAFDERVREKKQLILDTALQGELTNLVDRFPRHQHEQFPADEMKKVIAAFLVNCPCYRLYGDTFPLPEDEQRELDAILTACQQQQPDLREGIRQFRSVLLNNSTDNGIDKSLRFYQRLMQLTGPLMAKGVEDTLMYTYNRFIGHNEVGDTPGEFGLSIGRFHSTMKKRQRESNLSMSATATHDTKRGEDARMRLSVITDLSHEWVQTINQLMSSGTTLDKNVQYHVFQTIVGSYNRDSDNSYPERLEQYIRKALREGKRHSSWDDPNPGFEDLVTDFAKDQIRQGSDFLKKMHLLQERITNHGFVNSLAQLVIKATCPGVPDFYQGSLLWDFSFVDPDNRRPVDFASLNILLATSEGRQVEELWSQRSDGVVKLKISKSLLMLRRKHPDLFETGSYVPMRVTGKYSDHIIAFARTHQDSCVITACMLHSARMIADVTALTSIDWEETRIQLPEMIGGEYEDVLSMTSATATSSLSPSDVFKILPVALLEFTKRETRRSAGVLVHVTSLPSTFPAGDMGPGARSFADFLFESGQKRWQWLPINAIDPSANFSPYSSLSSMAGNPLLISHEDLAKDGLLNSKDFPKVRKPAKSSIDYNSALTKKDRLLSKAWKIFQQQKPTALWSKFEEFKLNNSDWLEGYSAFEFISQQKKEPWYKWPLSLRANDSEQVSSFIAAHADEIEKIKWIQFIFHKQITELKSYCNKRGIQLIGDLPFYVSHCSVDAWQHRHLFHIDVNGRLMQSAGVPPDYFSEEGQAWNMPVYNWEAMAAENYRWWVRRIEHTLRLFDYVRLDHFRAFSSYWSIPEGKSAREGQWFQGPGARLFEQLKKSIGRLPIIAEDLGDIGDAEIALREQFSMPGMKVLQFGFGTDFPRSVHLPHNYTSNFIAYTGTHDNNTTRGWYETEASDIEKKNLELILGKTLSAPVISRELIRMAYASVADTAIIPIQDILNLGDEARLNKPGTPSNNWKWRMRKFPDARISRTLRTLAWTFNR